MILTPEQMDHLIAKIPSGWMRDARDTFAAYAAVVRKSAEDDPLWESGFGNLYCVHCHGEEDSQTGEFQHDSDCAHTLACKLLGKEAS